MREQPTPIHHLARSWLDTITRTLPATLLLAAACGILPGCRLLVGTTVVAVGAVGLVGYGVYKTGEAAVTGVGSAVSGGAKGVNSVVFCDGEFKATCDGAVDDVWLASASTLKANGFRLVSGNRDALSGHLEAAAWDEEKIAVKLDDAGQGQTTFRMRIGTKGNLKKSETLYNLIVANITRRGGA
ncbi:MAG: DUF3568 domain-containing protein [Lentisphaerae bacterium]|nr:DUF3568 domain-containing protein [Lentisphaerota bacterium]